MTLTSIIRYAKDTVIDSIFPRRCPVCGEIVSPTGYFVCRSCVKKLDFVRNPICLKCGRELEDESLEYCYDCTKRSKSFEYGMALMNYDDTARHSMVEIKYKGKREYTESYAALITARYREKIKSMHADCLIPVPLHKTRERIRGYNQAGLLAQGLGKRLDIPVRTDILKRVKKTMPQKELSTDERLRNLTEAFSCDYLPSGIESCLLTDDIYTTGSTMEACTRVLLKAGMKRVYFVSICIAPDV